MELPDIVKELNKGFKATKITTLDKAESFKLKRMFTGSLIMDELTGGGWAYKRRHMLYGSRSAGKNATFNQTIAYNQRICRNCHGVLPEFYDNESDRHGMFLRWVLGLKKCECSLPIGKLFLVADYEKSLTIENESFVTVRKVTDKKTGELLDDLTYEEKILALNILMEKEKLSEEEKEEAKQIEKWLKGLNVETNIIRQEATKDYLIKCGVLVDKLMVCDPDTTEEGTEIIIPLIKNNVVDGILWDSLQAAIPSYINKRDADQSSMGAEGKSNGVLFRMMCSAFSARDLTLKSEAYKPAFFLTSQLRVSGLGTFVVKESYSGGMMVAHIQDFIGELKREKFLKIDGTESETFKDDFYGQSIRIRAEKNKLATPGDMYEYSYYFKDADHCKTGEIDHIGEIITLGTKKGIIEKSGTSYHIGTGELFKGKNGLREFLKNNPEFMGQIYNKIKVR